MGRNIKCGLTEMLAFYSHSKNLWLITTVTVSLLLKSVNLSPEESLIGRHLNYVVFHASSYIYCIG